MAGKGKGEAKAKGARSGAVGGPSTGHGMNYQIEYAVLLALELISQALGAPYKRFDLRVEPREPGPSGSTEWDLGIGPPETLVEVKLNPTRADMLDWLGRSAQAAQHLADHRFRLLYSRGGGPLLLSIRKMIRIAGEAAGDPDRFRDLVALEKVKESDVILGRLGQAPHLALRQMETENAPEDLLSRSVRVLARQLAGESGLRPLIDQLFHRLSRAVEDRASVPIRELIADLRGRGLELQAPPELDPDLPVPAAAALAILQTCPTGLPPEVLAQAVPCAGDVLEDNLQWLAREGALRREGAGWTANRLPARVMPRDTPDILARALEALLAYVETHRHGEAGRGQVRNAIELARACAGPRPKAAQRVFGVVEKHLKRTGDKHLVLEVAELAIECARRPPRGDGEARIVAQALICGRSWVYQRILRLDEAKLHADKSLRLGESIRWDRNSAFCKKCIGRLHRMEAEETADERRRSELLDESVACLEEAIGRFQAMSEFGPLDVQVGECLSLLARTQLVAGRLPEARRAASQARRLLPDPATKEYLDLAILLGDLSVAGGDHEAADRLYHEALAPPPEGDTERSEIRARALFQRGLNSVATGRTEPAILDFEAAAAIWRSLDEPRAAARAQWEVVRLAEHLPESVLDRLARELPEVRVAAIAIHRERRETTPGTNALGRGGPGPEYWEQTVLEARQRAAVEIVEW